MTTTTRSQILVQWRDGPDHKWMDYNGFHSPGLAKKLVKSLKNDGIGEAELRIITRVTTTEDTVIEEQQHEQ